jgi:hypothetical protein
MLSERREDICHTKRFKIGENGNAVWEITTLMKQTQYMVHHYAQSMLVNTYG